MKEPKEYIVLFHYGALWGGNRRKDIRPVEVHFKDGFNHKWDEYCKWEWFKYAYCSNFMFNGRRFIKVKDLLKRCGWFTKLGLVN